MDRGGNESYMQGGNRGISPSVPREITPDEVALFKQIGRRNFLTATLPLSLLWGTLYIAHVRRKGLRPRVVHGVGIFLLTHASVVSVKAKATRQEILDKCPDGYVAQLERRRQFMQTQGGVISPEEEGQYQRRLPQQYKPDTPTYSEPIRGADRDAKRSYDHTDYDDFGKSSMDKGGMDDTQRPSEDFFGPDEPHKKIDEGALGNEPKSYIRYEDLRRRNRGIDQPRPPPQGQMPFFERNAPSSIGSRRNDFEQPPVPQGKRNKYGDLIE